jgi:hypothetical protein
MRSLLQTLRGRLPASSLRLLLRAWMELRFGDTAALAWEEDSSSTLPGESSAPAIEQLLWRWSPAQLEGLEHLLKQAELHLPVREALLAFSRCLA